MQHVLNIQYVYLLNKYLKCSVWRLALRYDIYICMSLGFKRLNAAVTLQTNTHWSAVKTLGTHIKQPHVYIHINVIIPNFISVEVE